MERAQKVADELQKIYNTDKIKIELNNDGNGYYYSLKMGLHFMGQRIVVEVNLDCEYCTETRFDKVLREATEQVQAVIRWTLA